MKTASYIIMLLFCISIAVQNYVKDGQTRKLQVYEFKSGLYSAIILAVFASLMYWL